MRYADIASVEGSPVSTVHHASCVDDTSRQTFAASPCASGPTQACVSCQCPRVPRRRTAHPRFRCPLPRPALADRCWPARVAAGFVLLDAVPRTLIHTMHFATHPHHAPRDTSPRASAASPCTRRLTWVSASRHRRACPRNPRTPRCAPSCTWRCQTRCSASQSTHWPCPARGLRIRPWEHVARASSSNTDRWFCPGGVVFGDRVQRREDW